MLSPDSAPGVDLFAGDSEVERIARQLDWAATPLGAPEHWSERLRTAAHLVLDSRLPMTLAWGPELIQIYNDGYIPFLGNKHPSALAQPVCEVYAEIWKELAPLFDHIFRTREAVWREDRCLFLRRQGFVEECYFTFSFSPVRDNEGRVVGVLSSALETTDAVLSARRSKVLRRIGELRQASSVTGALEETLPSLDDARDDTPICLMLRRARDGKTLQLLGSTGLSEGCVPSLAKFDPWLSEAESGKIALPAGILDDLDSCGDGRPGASDVFLLPIRVDDVEAALVVGVSERLPNDERLSSYLCDLQYVIEKKVEDVRIHQLSLAAAEDRYHAVFEHSLDATLLASLDGEILAANAAAGELFGYSKAEFRALGRDNLVDKSDERWSHLFAERIDTGRCKGEVNFLHRDGHRVPCEFSANVYEDARRNQRVAIVARGIGDRLELEANLRQAQKLEVVGKLAGGIAHDFNNLLTAIHSAAQFLEAEVEPGTIAAEDVEVIIEASQRAAALTRRLLTFSRNRTIQRTHLDLGEVVQETIGLLRPLIGEDIEIVSVSEGKMPTIFADRQGIEQILLNLAVNARDAMPHGGELVIELERKEINEPVEAEVGPVITAGRYVCLRVSDTGVGIPNEMLPHVFEPFVTSKKEGTGLGLATVADVVIKCEGHLRVESEEGQGTSFEILLPQAHSSAAADSLSGPKLAPSKVPATKVLLIEDQPLVRKAIERMLERAGATTTAASSGEEALQIAQASGPDGFALVISDVLMPHMRGEEVVRRLREMYPHLKCLFISGYPDNLDRGLCDELAAGVLLKPFSFEELKGAILEALQS